MVNVWLPCPCHVVAPAILQSKSLCPCVRPAAVVLCLRSRNAILQSVLLVQLARPAKHSISYAVMFISELSLLACSAPWLSGVFSDLKPGFPLIVFSRIRRQVHDKYKIWCFNPLYQGWPTSQKPTATFLTVLPQRATSYTWAHMNITSSLPHSNTYLCSVRLIVNITHQHDKDRTYKSIIVIHVI